jgi:hypothetical protein
MIENYFLSATCQRYLKAILMVLFVSFIAGNAFAQQINIAFKEAESAVEVTEENFSKLNIKYTYSGLTSFGVTSERGTFNEISIPGTYWTGELGSPKLPASKDLIEIPFGAEVTVVVNSYSVSEYKLSEYGISHKVMPVQPSLRKDQDPDDVPFEYKEALYSLDAFIEHPLASVEILGVMRGSRIARLTIAPVSYNPVEGLIKVYNDIEVEIGFTNVDKALTEHIKASTYSPYFESLSSSLLNNLQHNYPDHPDLTKYPVKYLIVSDRMFENDLQPFIEWKTKKGFEIIIAYTDDIGSTYNQIQTWVHNQYNAATPDDPAPSFLLLVGDTPQIPASVGSSSGKMTDLYYASVDGDYFPEIYYGRFSANNSSELIPQIEKSLYYEQYEFANPSYLDKTTLIAGADGTWNPRVGQPTVIYGTNNYFNAANGYTDVFDYLTSPYTGCYDPEKIAVGFINYTAHCGQTSWGDPLLSQSMVNNFVNANEYPLSIGNCCLAADFGYPECIGETWMRAPNKGSVVYIGSSPNSYWFEDFYWAVGAFPIQSNNNGYVPTYEETTWGAFDAPFMSDYVSAGGLVFVGNLAVTEVHVQGYPSHSSPLYYWQAYNVLGDPSMVIYHTQGSDNSVVHMPIFPIGLDYYEVEALPGSYVAITKDGIIHGTALVGESGIAIVDIEPVLSGGNVDIVVTKPQHIPYMVQVPAVALDGPFIVVDGFSVSDSLGNSNGLADFEELVALNLDLKNVGSETSDTITGVISTSDPYIAIASNDTFNLGVVPADEIVTIYDAFAIQLADSLPDQHTAILDLVMTDGGDPWFSTIRLTLNAPIIRVFDSYTIDDSGSGNNDGILDPGETADLIIAVKNTGHADANNLIVDLESGNPDFVINSGPASFDMLQANQEIQVTYNVTAAEGIPIGTVFPLDVSSTAGTNSQLMYGHTLMVLVGIIPNYLMSNATETTCVGNFYDSGGPNGNYGNNQLLTMTFLPSTPGGKLKADFISFETENTYDKLHIYDGSNTSSPQFQGSPFSGTTSPEVISATNSDGALTFRFTSDGSINKPGWHAELSCILPTEPPQCATNPSPADGSIGVHPSTTLSWTGEDAISYDVYFGPTPDPPFVANVAQEEYTPELIPNTTYFWKIAPRNNVGPSVGCEIWSFTTSDNICLMGNETVEVSTGVFYDTGGPNANFSNNEDYSMTFVPLAPGYLLEFDFSFFSTQADYDLLYVYDGIDTDAPQLSGSPFSGVQGPGLITADNEDGAFTFRFVSNETYHMPGWEATFRAIGPLAAFPDANETEICPGQTAQLHAKAIGGSGVYTYNWTPASGLDYNHISEPKASPLNTTEYIVTLNDGESNADATIVINVHDVAVLNIGSDTLVCAYESVVLDASLPNAASYLWLPGGETTPSITVDTSGYGLGSHEFTAIVTDENGCIIEDDITLTFEVCTGYEDIISDLFVSIYPNPAKNILNLSIKGNVKYAEFYLLNYQGQLITTETFTNISGQMHRQIGVSEYPKGIYYIRINTQDNVIIRKLVIQ